MKNKRRYSIPAKLVELLWSDDEFFREVSSIKKAHLGSNFPKNDQWVDQDGFHLEFALAGYSPGDIEILVTDNILSISGNGLENLKKADALPDPKGDAFDEYVKDTKTSIHYGNIIRGIARRSFSTKLIISEDFEMDKVCATMENGLLHVVFPRKQKSVSKNIKINAENGE